MRIIKLILWSIFGLIVLINLAILFSGRSYLYKGIANTYLKGRSGPSITEFEIFSNRIITKGVPQPWPLSDNYNKTNIPDKFLSEFKNYQTTSFLVIKDDSIMHEEYWEGFKQTTLSNSFSMAKSIVGVLIGIAVTEGAIKNINDPVSDYVPEFKKGRKSTITIKNVLTMSSGIDFDEHYSSPFAFPAQAYYGNDLKKLTLKYEPNKDPGQLFEYLSGNSQILAMVLEAATGKKISNYASEKLWKKIGAEKDALWNLDRDNGDEKAFCCFISNARDFARFGKLYMNNGAWNGVQLIDSSYTVQSVQLAEMMEKDGSANNKYGYAWWILPDYKGHYIYYMRGILGQYVICIPDEKMIIVRLGRKRAPRVNDNHPEDFYIYLNAALEMFTNNK